MYQQLNGVKRGDKELTLSVRVKHGREEMYDDEFESDDYECSTPRKMQRPSYVLLWEEEGGGGGNSSGGSLSPATPPLYNHTNSSRRKGVPHRAPPF